MKRCVVCGCDAADSAPTCPMCGEASWRCGVRRVAKLDAQPAGADEEPTLPDAAMAPVQQQQRRHRRGRR